MALAISGTLPVMDGNTSYGTATVNISIAQVIQNTAPRYTGPASLYFQFPYVGQQLQGVDDQGHTITWTLVNAADSAKVSLTAGGVLTPLVAFTGPIAVQLSDGQTP